MGRCSAPWPCQDPSKRECSASILEPQVLGGNRLTWEVVRGRIEDVLGGGDPDTVQRVEETEPRQLAHCIGARQ